MKFDFYSDTDEQKKDVQARAAQFWQESMLAKSGIEVDGSDLAEAEWISSEDEVKKSYSAMKSLELLGAGQKDKTEFKKYTYLVSPHEFPANYVTIDKTIAKWRCDELDFQSIMLCVARPLHAYEFTTSMKKMEDFQSAIPALQKKAEELRRKLIV
mmetsp:Transcript_50512/g.117927  ORF Transcript_50512/g.117927 Transcript_50512/m.117927 type:complete len:156 (+) Transcript_50512:251-718(+)